MKKKLQFKRNIFTYITALVILSGAFACSTKVTFPVSSVVPAAEPVASINKTKEGAYLVKLDINNLALPERLSPPKKHYIVWIEAPGQGLIRLGEISNNSGMFKNRGKASFEKETRHKPAMLLVTAENSLDISYPGSNVILKSKPFELK
ncbi:hypothetical protein GCM10027284_07720 [Cyclobacterium sediminis]